MMYQDKKPQSPQHRREFFQVAATVGGGLTLGAARLNADESGKRDSARKQDDLRVGVVGIGSRGRHLVSLLLGLQGVSIRAVGDIVPTRVAWAQEAAAKAGHGKPAGYDRGPTDFERLCEREELDLVINATPWNWHVPICVAAMNAGKHAAVEVPAAVNEEGCWQLVETAEKTGQHCVMLENCCYGRTEMMFLNMVRKGLLGTVVHAEAGYMHEYRRGWIDWRYEQTIGRDGNLYPTHGLGPVAQCMNIDRGDRFDYLVSMSTRSSGMNDYFRRTLGPEHPKTKVEYSQGDVNVSMIRTVSGSTITLGYDVQLPRPYSRINIVQGTKGIAQGYPERISIEGSGNDHPWKSLEDYRQDYEHPLWQQLHAQAEGKGHGGMDYLVLYRLVEALRNGTEPDMDVYDAASWSVVSALSERSVANRSRPVDFPDFTRGKWKTRSPLGIVTA